MSDIPASRVTKHETTLSPVAADAFARQAYYILKFGFVVAPILAGADKFTDLLTNWDKYLAPIVNNAIGGHAHQFMMVVGVIEIVAGLGVLLLPRVFAYVVAAWL